MHTGWAFRGVVSVHLQLLFVSPSAVASSAAVASGNTGRFDEALRADLEIHVARREPSARAATQARF